MSRDNGAPFFTAQNPQFRVQTSPKIMNVAVRLAKHMPILGQPALSQTVCNFSLSSKNIISRMDSFAGILVVNHSGLFPFSYQALQGNSLLRITHSKHSIHVFSNLKLNFSK
jgi:hypothetical protein